MNWLEKRLVDDWRQCWKWSSVRLHFVIILANVLFAAMPTLDPAIAGMLPSAFRSPAFGIYSLAALALRLTKLKSGG